MRVIFGLAALAAVVNTVNGQTVTVSGNQYGGTNTQNGTPAPVSFGKTPQASINVFLNTNNGAAAPVSPTGYTNNGAFVSSQSFVLQTASTVSTIVFVFTTNQYTAQLQHRWSPNYPNPATTYGSSYGLSATSSTCDQCTTNPGVAGTPISCNTAVGPGGLILTVQTPSGGYNCANLVRTYTFSGLVASSTANPNFINSFAVQVFDSNTNPSPNTNSWSFQIVRASPAVLGDPQILGLQGQDFQVHGMPDEIFNMITYPNLQVNARFVYLSSGACHDNFTACFAHPGTYISEEGIRLGNDKIYVKAGSFKHGLSVSVNGAKVTERKTPVKLGSVEVVSHRRVIINTPILSIAISNSDKFLNQETTLFDTKLLALGSTRRVLSDGESFHSEVPLHGLQGQTWRNVEYPSGLEYEGSISDYHVTDGNLFGSSFVFNQYKQ